MKIEGELGGGGGNKITFAFIKYLKHPQSDQSHTNTRTQIQNNKEIKTWRHPRAHAHTQSSTRKLTRVIYIYIYK